MRMRSFLYRLHSNGDYVLGTTSSLDGMSPEQALRIADKMNEKRIAKGEKPENIVLCLPEGCPVPSYLDMNVCDSLESIYADVDADERGN